MLATPTSPGGCLPPPEEEVEENDELALEGSISMANEGEDGGGVNIACAMYSVIPSK